MVNSRRELRADFVRVVAIYFVLVVHSTSLPKQINTNSLDLSVITFSIVVSCVPLFVMLSGALLLGKTESFGVFLKKRIHRLILPWLTWSIIYTLIEFRGHSILGFLRAFLTTFESFWFLPMIVGLYLLTPALRTFIKNARIHDLWTVVILWFMAVSVLPYTLNSMMFPRQVDDGILRQVVNFLGYYLLGFALSRAHLPKLRILPLISIAIGIVWSLCETVLLSVAYGALIRDYYNYISPGIILVSVGIFLLIFQSKKQIEKRITGFWRSLLVACSTASFGIYFIHILIQRFAANIIRTSEFITNIQFDNFINGAILFTISFAIIFILCRVPKLRELVS